MGDRLMTSRWPNNHRTKKEQRIWWHGWTNAVPSDGQSLPRLLSLDMAVPFTGLQALGIIPI